MKLETVPVNPRLRLCPSFNMEGPLMTRLTFRKVEDRLVELSLIGAVVTSIVLNIIGVDVKWYIPGIFLALYGIFQSVADMREKRERGIESAFYRNIQEFYAAAQRQIQEAKDYVWATYTRTTPPTAHESAEANSYFQYTIDWARWHPDREFRRIVSVPDTAAMAAWLNQHRQDTKAIENYKVRVVPSYGRVDDIGLAIIDNKMVMLAVSGDGTSMTAHNIETPEAIMAFREYYLQKWENAEGLDEYVQRVRAHLPGEDP
jgi:hypothetical protein